MIRIDQLDSFSEHQYIVRDDDAMFKLADSICEYGVLILIIVRLKDNGRYEIISGHRRKRACEIAGLSEIPAFVFRPDDDEAAILLVDSNIQRENLLPGEKAYAYRLKYEAIEHRGVRASPPDSSALHQILDEVMQEKNILINQKRLKATFRKTIPYANARRSCGKYLMSGIKETEGNENV